MYIYIFVCVCVWGGGGKRECVVGHISHIRWRGEGEELRLTVMCGSGVVHMKEG